LDHVASATDAMARHMVSARAKTNNFLIFFIKAPPQSAAAMVNTTVAAVTLRVSPLAATLA
jgi:hypothetical protein